MKSTRVISISMPEAQAKVAERLAKAENRTMSELMREALRHYERQRRQEKIKENRSRLKAMGIKEEDVVTIIKEWRKQQRSERAGAPQQPRS